MMNLITGLSSIGYHPGSWRHPTSWPDPIMNFERLIECAKTAERGKFDMLFLADGNSVRMNAPRVLAAGGLLSRPAIFEPVTLLSAIAMHTSRIGLLATATTTYEEPFTLARKFASLDHLSKGRASWNVVTTSNTGDAFNFGRENHPARVDRYERAREFVQVCKGLWDSWAEDAFTQDRESGQILDPSRIHVLNHKGKYLSVRGPLNIGRPPQGYPVLFMAGQSEPGRELSASMADCQFAVTPTKDEAMEYYADLKGRMDKYGRRPEDLRVMPGATIYVGRTAEEADEFFDELQSRIPPELGVDYLSGLMTMDLSKYPIDGPVPEPQEIVGGSSRRYVIYDMAKRENLTIRQTYERVIPTVGHVLMKGNGKQVADQMEDWYRSKACDGFNIHIPHQPGGLDNFVDFVIPELQRRGVFRTEYEGNNLREMMGLLRPPNPFFTEPALSETAAE
jgi:FMN-dependent oxidoreductase (nitrilotriacetate monooxygenase family)